MRKNRWFGFVIVFALLFVVSLMSASAGLLSFIDDIKTINFMTGNAIAVHGAFCGDGLCQAPYEDGMNCAVDCSAKKNLFGYAATPPPKADKAKKPVCVTNNILDAPPETDVDCGASCKIKCSVGNKCVNKTDCSSAICTSSACQPAKTCTDKKFTKGETSIDCGGIKCAACDLGKTCKLNSDCKSGRCDPNHGNVCVSCSDGIMNGDETDKDCGGSCPNKCDDSSMCTVNLDCKSKVCAAFGNSYQCHAPTCFDLAQNGDETDVDCGGSCKTTVYGQPVPIRCDVGKGCNVHVDCKSNNCVSEKCVAPTCTDSRLNQDETDVDCGGVACGSTCGQGKICNANSDCQTGNCEYYQGKKQCLPVPTCSDGRTNQGESDVDCGGMNCPKCIASKHCNNGGDCDSTVCSSGVCQAPTCMDGHKNGAEADVDCGGPCNQKCTDLRMCTSNSDCQSSLCDPSISKCASCTDGVQDGDEVGIDCGGSCSTKCSIDSGCVTPADCVSNNCVDGYCAKGPTCSNGVKDGGETDVDCGGVDKNGCNACAAGKICSVNTDCTDTVCSPNAPSGNICQSSTYKAPVAGTLGGGNCYTVSGWACDPDDYTKPLTIRVYSGISGPSSLIQTVTASDASSDAAPHCGGNSNHGFTAGGPGNHDTLWVYADNIGAGGPAKLIGTHDRNCF